MSTAHKTVVPTSKIVRLWHAILSTHTCHNPYIAGSLLQYASAFEAMPATYVEKSMRTVSGREIFVTSSFIKALIFE